MKIFDENDIEIYEPDLSKGFLVNGTRIKPDASPIDNVKKFAWDDDDYEEIQRYVKYTDDELVSYKSLIRKNQMETAVGFLVRSASLTDEQALSVSEFYEEWEPDRHYLKNDIRRYEGLLYRCIQEHDGQASWTPDQAHSLWVQIRPKGEILEWEKVQPGINEPYSKGDKVTWKGKIWISDIDNNVWEPGIYGWSEVTD